VGLNRRKPMIKGGDQDHCSESPSSYQPPRRRKKGQREHRRLDQKQVGLWGVGPGAQEAKYVPRSKTKKGGDGVWTILNFAPIKRN